MRPTEPRAIISRERELACLDMKREGYSFRQIAENLGITEQGASKAFKRAMGRTIAHTAETVEEIKATEIERLDALIKAHWPYAIGGYLAPDLDHLKRPIPGTGKYFPPDPVRAGVIFRSMERRSALLGLDAPKIIKTDEKQSDIDATITELIRRLGVTNSPGEVPPTVEIDCTAQSTDPLRSLGELVLHGGSRLGQDENRS